MLIYSLSLFVATTLRSSIRDGTKFYYRCPKIPSDEILESLYKLRISESDQFKTVLELYDMEIHQEISMANNQRLKTTVKRSINQKLRLGNFDARHEKIETGAVVKYREGMSGVEGGKGTCYQRREKGQCSKGDHCSSAMRVRIVHKNRHQKSRHPLSHHLQKHEVEVRREKERQRQKPV